MVTPRRNNSHVEYWRERSEILQESLLNNGDEAVKHLEGSYKKALLEIEKSINSFYGRFAGENGMDYVTAKRILNSAEIKRFRMELEEYIKKGKTLNYSKQWAKQLENASTAYRITRLKMLELQIQQQLELLYREITVQTEQALATIYEEGYYQQLYMLEQQTGKVAIPINPTGGTSTVIIKSPETAITVDFTKLDSYGVKSIIHQSWAADGSSFSDRVWMNKTRLVTKVLNEKLPVAFIRGETPAKTIREVSEVMGNSWYNARRIVLTESAAYAARATQDAYSRFGVEKYEFLATTDEKTCLRCGGLESMSNDKGGLPKELYKIGSTAPPLHPHCRCTTDDNTFGDDTHSLTLGSVFRSNTFGNHCPQNGFMSHTQGNVFGAECFCNDFGSNFFGNITGNNFTHNRVDSSCLTNTIGNGFTVNVIGTSFINNNIGSDCQDNAFAAHCYSNYLGANCSGNQFGSDFAGNTLNNNNTANTFGVDCRTSTFGSYFCNNVVDRLLAKNVSSISELHNKNYPHTISMRTDGAFVATWLNASNTPQYSVL